MATGALRHGRRYCYRVAIESRFRQAAQDQWSSAGQVETENCLTEMANLRPVIIGEIGRHVCTSRLAMGPVSFFLLRRLCPVVVYLRVQAGERRSGLARALHAIGKLRRLPAPGTHDLRLNSRVWRRPSLMVPGVERCTRW